MNTMVRKVSSLFTKARMDPEYAALSEEYRQMQRAFERLTAGLTEEEQDIAWAFVCISDQMNWRMLELICQWHEEYDKNRH